MTVNIAGLGKAAVLAALHNATRAIGFGKLHDIGRDMTAEEAAFFINEGDDHREFDAITKRPRLYFDYVQGRPIKTDIGSDEFDPWLFDRDAGDGAAEKAINRLRANLQSTAA